jgi:hypothetical protein
MNDIYDIKWNLFWIPFHPIMSIMYIVIIGGILFFIMYYYKKQKVSYSPEKEKNLIKRNLREEFETLNKQYWNMEDEKFYAIVRDILSSFIEQKYEYNIMNMTLSEISKLPMDFQELTFFKKVYFLMYEENITKEKREVLKELKNILQNNIS